MMSTRNVVFLLLLAIVVVMFTSAASYKFESAEDDCLSVVRLFCEAGKKTTSGVMVREKNARWSRYTHTKNVAPGLSALKWTLLLSAMPFACLTKPPNTPQMIHTISQLLKMYSLFDVYKGAIKWRKTWDNADICRLSTLLVHFKLSLENKAPFLPHLFICVPSSRNEGPRQQWVAAF